MYRCPKCRYTTTDHQVFRDHISKRHLPDEEISGTPIFSINNINHNDLPQNDISLEDSFDSNKDSEVLGSGGEFGGGGAEEDY